MLVIPSFSRLKQKDGKFKINLGYIIIPSLVAGKVVQSVRYWLPNLTTWVQSSEPAWYKGGKRMTSAGCPLTSHALWQVHTNKKGSQEGKTEGNFFNLKKTRSQTNRGKKKPWKTDISSRHSFDTQTGYLPGWHVCRACLMILLLLPVQPLHLHASTVCLLTVFGKQ